MALTTSTIWEVESGGDDTNNGGCFDYSQTAGMFADGSAASATAAAPSFTSASYAFVSGDASAHVYIASGTNWNPGWYYITSVSASAAILNANIGQACSKPGPSTSPIPSTLQGCATVANASAATWTIDYSQRLAAAISYTDLTSAASGLVITSAAHPFAKQQVGNSLVVTSGTNFTAGRYVVASVSASAATLVGAANVTTGIGASGVGGLGGCLASPGGAGIHSIASQGFCIKSATYTITSATQNIAAGCFKPTGGVAATHTWIEGYQTVRGDRGTRPTLILNTGVSTTKLIDLSAGTYQRCINLILDGHAETSSQGVLLGTFTYLELIKAQNCTNSGFSSAGGFLNKCEATGCSTQPAFALAGGNATITGLFACESHGNTVTGISMVGNIAVDCLSYSNSGATSDGFYMGSSRGVCINCNAYNNGRSGFRGDTGNPYAFINCVAEANAEYGFGSDNVTGHNPYLIFPANYNNTSGAYASATYNNSLVFGAITLTASPFTSATGGNFALNNTAGAGALLRAHGYPTAFPSGNTSNYLDAGAAQHQETASGGGLLTHPGLSGGMRS
jgi:hypothetical protein